jgi:hypothetical protein
MRVLKIIAGLGLLIAMAGCAVYAPPPPYGHRDGHRGHYWSHPSYDRY